jgi:hypothetical protein
MENLRSRCVSDLTLEPGAAVQVLLLRDGLLAGSHALLAGTFSIGSSELAEVMLDDPGVSGEHARLHFGGGRVEIEATGGPVYVNGHRVRRCRVRPADDLTCGPFILKVRVLRAAKPKDRQAPLAVVPVVTLPSARAKALSDAAPTTRVELPRVNAAAAPPSARAPADRTRPVRAEALFIESRWGEQRCHAICVRPGSEPLVAGPSDAAAFPLWGFRTGTRFVLADGAFRVFIPPGAIAEVGGNPVEAGARAVEIRSGDVVRLRSGSMEVIARRGPLPESARGKFAGGAPIGLAIAAALVIVLGRAVPTPEPGPDFDLHAIPQPTLRLLINPPRPPAPPQNGTRPPEASAASALAGGPRIHRTRTSPSGGLEAVRQIFRGGSAVADIMHVRMGRTGAPPSGRGFKMADLVAAGPVGDGFLSGFGRSPGTRGSELLHGTGGSGIGAMGAGGYGHGMVRGQVSGANPHPHTTGGGQIDSKGVLEVVNSHLSEIQACYETALLHRADISGTAKLEWVVSTSGEVVSARTLSSTLPDAAVESCILRHLKTWHFPRARMMPVTISYPFIFHPVAG